VDLIKLLREAVQREDWLEALELLARHSGYYSQVLKYYDEVVRDVIHNALVVGADPLTVVTLASRLGVNPTSFQTDLDKALINLAIKDPAKAMEECREIGACSPDTVKVIEALNNPRVYAFAVKNDKSVLENYSPKDWEDLETLVKAGVIKTNVEIDRRYAAEKLFAEIVDNDIAKVPQAVSSLLARGYTEYRDLEDFIKNPDPSKARQILVNHPSLGPAVVTWAIKKFIDEGEYSKAAEMLKALGFRVEERTLSPETLRRAEEALAYAVLGAIVEAVKKGNMALAERLFTKYMPYLERFSISINGQEMTMAAYVNDLFSAVREKNKLDEAKEIRSAIQLIEWTLNNYNFLKKLNPELPPREAFEALLNLYKGYMNAYDLFKAGHIRVAIEALHRVLDEAQRIAREYPSVAPYLLNLVVETITPEDIRCVLEKSGLWPPTRGAPSRAVRALLGGGYVGAM